MNRGSEAFDRPSLDGKVALVTGGNGGIGSAVVESFVRAGARVVSVDLPGTTAVHGAETLGCDLSDPTEIAAMFQVFKDRFDRLDVLVHCAGITRDGVSWKMEQEAWQEVMRVNLDAAFLLLKQAVPMMRAGDGGAVVLVSSINGERGKFGQANYAASKAGLIGLGRTIARETGRFGIRVNIVSPGLIETAMTAPLPEEARRQAIEESALESTGWPEDVAAAVLFLASPMSRHITGQVLRVDGGQLMA